MQRIYLKLGDGTSSLALSLYQSLCVHVCERNFVQACSNYLAHSYGN